MDLDKCIYNKKRITADLSSLHYWENYSEQLPVEYRQCIDEGLDIQQYKDLFDAAAKMPCGEDKKRIADVLFDIVLNSDICPSFEYEEPSALDEIKKLRIDSDFNRKVPDTHVLKDKVYGAWLGRVCGCLLGKPVEGITTDELIPLLKESGNFPMSRYILSSDITDEMNDKFKFKLKERCYADTVSCMPADDDTNYTVLSQLLIDKYSADFTAKDVAALWVDSQPKNAYCTAERAAFCNFVKGYMPPDSAMYKNPFREWIGAQIRGDYFGYINPGSPEKAAEMAFRDASISHVKNGIYGEMFISAMIACAAASDNVQEVIRGGLGQIPHTSRLYKAVQGVIDDYHAEISCEECFEKIHKVYNEDDGYDWCHTIPNAVIVTASLLYGGGSFGKSICTAVQTGFDTDCNGATVGSIVGMMYGTASIGDKWKQPINDELETSIFGIGKVKLSDCADKTMEHINIIKNK